MNDDGEAWIVHRNQTACRAGDPTKDKFVLITGGAGFVGTNLAHRLASGGARVLVYDNLSRAGVERNLAWLKAEHGARVEAVIADIRDTAALRGAVQGARTVFHFAAQAAVTTSMRDPTEDFAVNAGGALNVLEALRACAAPPPLVFTSTNKVYGPIEDLPLDVRGTRYDTPEGARAAHGVDEHQPLDFHTPYGCSKGAADQYVLDYSRSYHLNAVVFRMSCIYGPHQFGTEDQGWVAHFLRRAIGGKPITIYGDGRQVRDILYVEDLVDALLLAERRMDGLRGQAFNIGGGHENSTSLLELVSRIASCLGRQPNVTYADWRPGDQRYYVSDYRKFARAAGWQPRVSAAEGIERLYEWLARDRARFGSTPMPTGGRNRIAPAAEATVER